MRAESDFDAMRAYMIDCQLRPNSVTNDDVVAAFRAVPRELFVPAAKRSFAYSDEEIDLGNGRVLVEPLVTGRLIAEARVKEGDRVLIIGGTTGYSSAICLELGATVVLHETETMAAEAAKVMETLPGMTITSGDLADFDPDGGPFDLILIEGAISALPENLVSHVAEGGRIAAIVVDNGTPRAGIGRVYGGHVGWTWYMEAFVPMLPGFAAKPEFVF
ncbi:MAG: protein-L-isoaspartate O-methyltransferase [Pacificimonas sp.]